MPCPAIKTMPEIIGALRWWWGERERAERKKEEVKKKDWHVFEETPVISKYEVNGD